jgi:hypothetical protein
LPSWHIEFSNKATLSSGLLTCTECGLGKYASANHDRCDDCPTGAYCSSGLKHLCSAGTSNNQQLRSTPCAACGPGKFTASSGESTCEFCADGTFVNTTKSGCEVCQTKVTTLPHGALIDFVGSNICLISSSSLSVFCFRPSLYLRVSPSSILSLVQTTEPLW